MTLTIGTAPFGSAVAGRFDVDAQAPLILRDGDREERDVVCSCPEASSFPRPRRRWQPRLPSRCP
jgi:hypothetical protein